MGWIYSLAGAATGAGCELLVLDFLLSAAPRSEGMTAVAGGVASSICFLDISTGTVVGLPRVG